MKKRIIPQICVNHEPNLLLVQKAEDYENHGADELYVCDFRQEEQIQEQFLLMTKAIVKSVDIPVIIGVAVKRFEDVKKAFYTGAKGVVLSYAELPNPEVVEESIQRFGKEQIIVEIEDTVSDAVIVTLKKAGVSQIMCKNPVNLLRRVPEAMSLQILASVQELSSSCGDADLTEENVFGIVVEHMNAESVMEAKKKLQVAGIDVNLFESELDFSEFKLDTNGLIPAIVQDYKTNEVLMMGYMNEESFEKTIQTGRMTYYSRSRQELWVKGETSGHYQYVKELKIDCDKDTILAKVKQVGAACHTGNRSCFYTDLVTKEYDTTNPFTVFEDVYGVIMDRKEHPKEGSYTNYLFDKGIDKILKKCGEEATEIVIAAKNPEVEELKYEISDFLYHCMVLMAERGVDWEDITRELAHRR